MRKTLTTFGTAAALVLTLATAAGQPAAAAPAPAAGWARCPNGYFCIFDGVNGTGTIAYFKSGSPDLRGQSMDKRTSSYWSRNAEGFSLHDGYNYGGSCFSVFPGAQTNLPSSFPAWDNRASSISKYVCG
ncbi:peptidase inhibitor family I36 protein [Streptomyces sp. NPDC001941]|uniref:peptidase inhibitor family I36 protein n=1 Tax=Streptomyces sp. NPDC001941 TaxID=3154659 RepID=UPI00331B60E7